MHPTKLRQLDGTPVDSAAIAGFRNKFKGQTLYPGDEFWGLRGGGGNFGVVTSFVFRAHPVKTVLSGLLLYPRADARAVLRHYRAFMATAPEELTAYAGLLSTPDGVPVVGMIICYCGTLAEGERVLAPLRQFGTPVPRRASGIRTLHFHIAPRCTT